MQVERSMLIHQILKLHTEHICVRDEILNIYLMRLGKRKKNDEATNVLHAHISLPTHYILKEILVFGGEAYLVADG